VSTYPGDPLPDWWPPRNYSSRVAEKFCAISGAELLFGVTVSNSNAAARFVLLFDLELLPADGTVPSAPFSVAATGDKQLLWMPPRRIERGILLAGSTTQNTLTLGAAEFLFDVQYI